MLGKRSISLPYQFFGGHIMPDNRFICSTPGSNREMVCIEANRVLDSCRDRDCYENVQVFLTAFGNEIIEIVENIFVNKTNYDSKLSKIQLVKSTL